MLTSSVLAKKYAIDPVSGGEFVGIIFAKAGEEVLISETIEICSDPDDDPIIETAYAGRVDYLVAEDRHFFEPDVKALLATVGIRVLWPSEFRKELARRRAPTRR
jgi:predicted nucleic acid-binding protein